MTLPFSQVGEPHPAVGRPVGCLCEVSANGPCPCVVSGTAPPPTPGAVACKQSADATGHGPAGANPTLVPAFTRSGDGVGGPSSGGRRLSASLGSHQGATPYCDRVTASCVLRPLAL